MIRPSCPLPLTLSLTVALALAFGLTRITLSAQTPADQQAKVIAKEAEALKKSKKLVEARAKYVEALRLAENPKYSMKIAEIETEIGKQIEKRLDESAKLFSGGKHAEALETLEAAEALRNDDPVISYNRALILEQQGKRAEAIESLDKAISTAPEKEQARLRQLKTLWATGETLQKMTPARQESVEDLNAQMASAEDIADVCNKLRPLATSMTRSASLVFNLAKCAEEDGNLEEAARLLEEYLNLAPGAADGAETKVGLHEVRDLEARVGPEVLGFYSESERAARKRQYTRAIDALLKAVAAAPAVSETHLRLARLYQASDNTAAARQYYGSYLTLETSEPLLVTARQELEALENREAEYSRLLAPALERLQALTRRYVLDRQPMGVEAARQELRQIAEQLQQASVMMPLAVDVNRMLGQVYLSDGNYAAARKAFTAVAEAGAPIWFYAVARSFEPIPKNAIVKVELKGVEMRVIGLARDEKKKRLPLVASATDDSARMGNFLAPFDLAAGTAPAVVTSAVALVETDNDTLKVSWNVPASNGPPKRRESQLVPLRFTSTAPPTGPAARRFANAYTKLFRDFGDRKVALGPEKMTGGEKFGMVMNIAMAAYMGGAMGMMSGAHGTAYAIATAMRSVTWATIALQNALDAQARMLQESEFKIIPVEDVKPTFRTELFK